ncbi:MAG: major facilitator superfamily domain-containing protein 1 [Chlorobi bacterium]|nr:major facilitator superfamily domain-containing protein 1 [Chlorobiota bacterium]
MTEHIRKSLRESTVARWTALVLVSLSIFGAYYFNYALSAIKPMLESILGWNSGDFGTYTSAYAWFNVFLVMLIISGFILDKLGVRKTGLGATLIMFIGTAINYWAISHQFPENAVVHLPLLGDMKTQVLWSSFGFAIFGVGTEATGITISKAVVRWFKGKELALAMGMQMSIARLGTGLALGISIPLAKKFSVTAPILFALIVMLIGVISFISFSIMDIKLDKSEEASKEEKSEEDEFKIKDIGYIITNRGFWYIAILCVLFYSAVFPFLFYANDLMINKYNVSPNLAGTITLLLPFGTIFLTPVFGGIYDKFGKGATIMIVGAMILVFVHGVLAIPSLRMWWVAAAMVIILGVGFSLVPSAMWPSVPKIIPEKQLGTAYAVIFWIQNIGLLFIPLLLGFVLNATNPDVSPNKILVKGAIEKAFKESLSTAMFTPKEIDRAIEKATGTAVDSIVQYSHYEPVPSDVLDKKKVGNEIYTGIRQNINNVNLSGNKDVVLIKVIRAGSESAFQAVNEEKLNLRYNYLYDILIFLALSVISLLFAFLLKIEDRKKDYGLEKPNIQKAEA